jgi:hypothetical protein
MDLRARLGVCPGSDEGACMKLGDILTNPTTIYVVKSAYTVTYPAGSMFTVMGIDGADVYVRGPDGYVSWQAKSKMRAAS